MEEKLERQKEAQLLKVQHPHKASRDTITILLMRLTAAKDTFARP